MPPRLLIVHHTTSPSLHALFDAARAGASDPTIDADVEHRPALTAAAADVLGAQGVLLGTPANLGYISGALKHFFDQIYYPCLESTVGMPFGIYIHGNNDTTGAMRAIEAITTGLQWRLAQAPLVVLGDPSPDDLAAAHELGASLAAGLTL